MQWLLGVVGWVFFVFSFLQPSALFQVSKGLYCTRKCVCVYVRKEGGRGGTEIGFSTHSFKAAFIFWIVKVYKLRQGLSHKATRFESQLCNLLNVQPWAGYIASLCLSFLICKMELLMYLLPRIKQN